jgi:hypothetical protein
LQNASVQSQGMARQGGARLALAVFALMPHHVLVWRMKLRIPFRDELESVLELLVELHAEHVLVFAQRLARDWKIGVQCKDEARNGSIAGNFQIHEEKVFLAGIDLELQHTSLDDFDHVTRWCQGPSLIEEWEIGN